VVRESGHRTGEKWYSSVPSVSVTGKSRIEIVAVNSRDMQLKRESTLVFHVTASPKLKSLAARLF